MEWEIHWLNFLHYILSQGQAGVLEAISEDKWRLQIHLTCTIPKARAVSPSLVHCTRHQVMTLCYILMDSFFVTIALCVSALSEEFDKYKMSYLKLIHLWSIAHDPVDLQLRRGWRQFHPVPLQCHVAWLERTVAVLLSRPPRIIKSNLKNRKRTGADELSVKLVVDETDKCAPASSAILRVLQTQ